MVEHVASRECVELGLDPLNTNLAVLLIRTIPKRQYDDIKYLTRLQYDDLQPTSMSDRATQFSPFAALVNYDDTHYTESVKLKE